MDDPSVLALAILLKVGDLPQPPPDDTLEQLFNLSRAAHLNYRQNSQQGLNPGGALAFLTVAARLRSQIQLLDPNHLNPAWQFNGGTHLNGNISQDDLNTPLLAFYLNQLNRA